MAYTGTFSQDALGAHQPGAVDLTIRSALFMAVFLTLWFSFHPFPTLDQPLEVTDVGDPANQIGYSTFFALLAAWNLTHQPQRLLLLIRPMMIAVLLWFALTVVLSWDPSLSMRRFAFALVLMSIAGMVLLLPRSPRHFADMMGAVAIIVIVACYLGVTFAPAHSIHQASDIIEPDLAGDWRGIFGHKNDASAAMVIFIFTGLLAARLRGAVFGGAIVAAALPFLYFTHSKTAIAAMILAYVISVIVSRVRTPAAGFAVVLSVLIALNLISIGSIYIAPVHTLVDAIMSDPTFTGRSDIWKFAIDHVAQRPITGYGFSAFWGTEDVVYGMAGATWANTASHAHNGYLDFALTIGIPGSLLVTLWVVVLPIADYYRARSRPDGAALRMFFLRICLFIAYQSCFETLFTLVGVLWLIMFLAVFGLRYAAVARVSS